MTDFEGDDGWQHQQACEEEQLLIRSRVLTAELRRATAAYEAEMNELKRRIDTNWRNFDGNHG